MYTRDQLVYEVLPKFLRESGAEFVRRSQGERERAFVMHEGGGVVHVPMDELAEHAGPETRAEVEKLREQQMTPLVVIGVDVQTVLPILPAEVEVFRQPR